MLHTHTQKPKSAPMYQAMQCPQSTALSANTGSNSGQHDTHDAGSNLGLIGPSSSSSPSPPAPQTIIRLTQGSTAGPSSGTAHNSVMRYGLHKASTLIRILDTQETLQQVETERTMTMPFPLGRRHQQHSTRDLSAMSWSHGLCLMEHHSPFAY